MNILPPEIIPTVSDRILARSQAPQRAYAVRLASTLSDLHAAQSLRFAVFNLELREGLAKSYMTGRDADQFDEFCDHLLVEDLETGEVVGTYRLQTGLTAKRNLGYYSEQEFDFTPFESIRNQTVELGRACVHSQHRNLVVLSQLWKGIYEYAQTQGGRYLMGCSSITSQDPLVGATMYSALQRRHSAPPPWQTQPRPKWACPLEHLRDEAPRIPKLLAAYLSLGAKICGPPALDREFRTIDFLTLLDLDSLSPTTVRRYLS
jgi:putative hemolysin